MLKTDLERENRELKKRLAQIRKIAELPWPQRHTSEYIKKLDAIAKLAASGRQSRD